MKQRMIVGLVAAGCALGAFADFEIKLDLSGKPMRDLSKTTSKTIVGYINAMHGPEYNDDYFFVSNRMETARVMKKAGCCNCATWGDTP